VALGGGHHLDEGAQVPGEGVQVRATGQDRGERRLLAGVKAGPGRLE
jgi:hypothetical protein